MVTGGVKFDACSFSIQMALHIETKSRWAFMNWNKSLTLDFFPQDDDLRFVTTEDNNNNTEDL